MGINKGDKDKSSSAVVNGCHGWKKGYFCRQNLSVSSRRACDDPIRPSFTNDFKNIRGGSVPVDDAGSRTG